MWITQPVLLIVALACVVLPFFKPFDSAALVGCKSIPLLIIIVLIGLWSLLRTRVVYMYNVAIYAKFFEDSKIQSFFELDATCTSGRYSKEETNTFKEKYESIIRQLHILLVFLCRFQIFDIAAIFAIFIGIFIRSFLKGTPVFFSLYAIPIFLIIFQMASFSMFGGFLKKSLTMWKEKLTGAQILQDYQIEHRIL